MPIEYEFKIGDKCRIYFSEGNINNTLIEIRGIVDGHIIYVTEKGTYNIDEYGMYLTKLKEQDCLTKIK